MSLDTFKREIDGIFTEFEEESKANHATFTKRIESATMTALTENDANDVLALVEARERIMMQNLKHLAAAQS